MDSKISNAVCLIFYGLAEIYIESGDPIMPIIPCIGHCDLKSSILLNWYHVFKIPPRQNKKNKFKGVSMSKNFVLASLDVISFFTNVPKEAAISTVNSR